MDILSRQPRKSRFKLTAPVVLFIIWTVILLSVAGAIFVAVAHFVLKYW